MNRILKFALPLMFCVPAYAEVETGHYHQPARPGSGVSVHRSGEAIFATVLEYDAQGRPTWLFASDIRGTNIELDPGGRIFEGALYTATGTPMEAPAFTSFAPAPVGRISMWQFQGTLTVTVNLDPACPTCERQVVTRQYVRLM